MQSRGTQNRGRRGPTALCSGLYLPLTCYVNNLSNSVLLSIDEKVCMEKATKSLNTEDTITKDILKKNTSTL